MKHLRMQLSYGRSKVKIDAAYHLKTEKAEVFASYKHLLKIGTSKMDPNTFCARPNKLS